MNRRAAKARARAEFARRLAAMPDPLAGVPKEYRSAPWEWHDLQHKREEQAAQRKIQQCLFYEEDQCQP